MVVTFGHNKRKAPKADHTYDVRDLSHWMDSPEANDVVEKACQAYQKGQTIALGCEQGQHRSVVLGDRIAKRLGVPVKHMDAAKVKPKVNTYSW